MVWVRSEYAGELAVLLTWLSAVIPWSVQYSTGVAGGSLLFVRFPFFQVRFAFGVPFAESLQFVDPLSAIDFQRGQSIQAAYEVWAVGAGILAVATLLAGAYYLREERLDAAAVDPTRLLGALLGLAGVVLGISTYLLWARGFPGLPVPLGVGFLLLFGGILLTAERTD